MARLPNENYFYKPKAKPLVVKANQKFAFNFQANNGSLVNYAFCSSTQSFKPQLNPEYLVTIIVNSNSCGITVNRAIAGNLHGELEKSLKVREQLAPFSTSASFCKPL